MHSPFFVAFLIFFFVTSCNLICKCKQCMCFRCINKVCFFKKKKNIDKHHWYIHDLPWGFVLHFRAICMWSDTLLFRVWWQTANQQVGCWSPFGNLSVICWPTVERQVFWGAPLHNWSMNLHTTCEQYFKLFSYAVVLTSGLWKQDLLARWGHYGYHGRKKWSRGHDWNLLFALIIVLNLSNNGS